MELKVILLVAVGVAVLADEFHDFPPWRDGPLKSAAVEDGTYWHQLGQRLLRDELNKRRHNVKAKNIILFLGDGMSIPTVTASRIYKGQKVGRTGEEEQMTFDKFPYAALSRTYCTDAQVADSACSATAYLSGIKTKIGTLGLDANVVYKNCSTQNDPANRVSSVFAWAQAAGLGTGIVTTASVTDATVAGAYAHAANRDWQDDSEVVRDGQDPVTCDDIAEQMVLNAPGSRLKVILGGGRTHFTPGTHTDPETGGGGSRCDGVNLINAWIANNPTGAYVIDRHQLLDVDVSSASSLLGLFAPGHMDYYLESANANDPSLQDMTRAAIRMLQQEIDGYVLLVEGGRIDHAHHGGRAKMALEEALQFDLAVQAALDLTDPADTLIIVTADHSHTLTLSGYPKRGNSLLGLAGSLGTDLKPYTTLSYANGPGYTTAFSGGTRPDLTGVDTASESFRQPATVPLDSETHGGDDVAIFAVGPQAHLFQGVYEQNYIAHVMGYAACIGPGLKFCTADQ